MKRKVALLLVAIFLATLVVVSAEKKCEREITGGKSWKKFIKKIKNSSKKRCSNKRGLKDRDECECDNPMKPIKGTSSGWKHARKKNLGYIKDAKGKKLDVVMVGDSLIEKWHGRKQGRRQDTFKNNAEVYEKFFDLKKGKVYGLALGIGGDRIPRLLYRLENGEMDKSLQPKVWWVLIGTNDMGGGNCNVKNVIAGIVNIARLILKERPKAKVVLNSLLPREKEGKVYREEDYRAVNEALECFADNTDRVEYFNGWKLFLKGDGVSEKLLPDGVHPDEDGLEVWGDEIVKKVKAIT